MDVLLFRGISITWKNGLTGVLRSSAQGTARSCTHRGLTGPQTPPSQTGSWEVKQLSRKGPTHSSGQEIEHETTACPCRIQGYNILVCIRENVVSLSTALPEVIIVLCKWRDTWSAVSSSELSWMREKWTFWSKFSKGTWRLWRHQSICYKKERLRELALFILKNRRLGGILQMWINTSCKEIQKTELEVRGQEAKGTNLPAINDI